jgi:hypothetical protein
VWLQPLLLGWLLVAVVAAVVAVVAAVAVVVVLLAVGAAVVRSVALGSVCDDGLALCAFDAQITSDPIVIVPNAPARLALTLQPAGATGGRVFSPQPELQLHDAVGNQLANSNITVSVWLHSWATNCSSTLHGTTTATFSGGIARFTDLMIMTYVTSRARCASQWCWTTAYAVYVSLHMCVCARLPACVRARVCVLRRCI